MRILLRPRLPVLALLLFAPGIAELLTGSTPITRLFFDPIGFLLSFGFDVALYGTGALLIREFAVVFRKGWASILLLGAAYGIAEEGFAVHTFFQATGSPVNALGTYGHAFGVNWVWALGLSVFHATYSIALPILLTQLWFPLVKDVRWFDPSALGLVGAIYLATVVIFDVTSGHGPSPAAFALFLAVALLLVGLARWIPRNLLAVGPGRARVGPWGIALAGTLGFDAWILVLLLSTSRLPAIITAAIFVLIDLGALALVLRRLGADDLEGSKFWFATGMLGILFVWDVAVAEFSVPGIVLVSAVFAYVQYRLGTTLRARGVLAPLGADAPSAG